MVTQTRWVEREFRFGIPIGYFPCILERFRGTPARMEEMLKHLDPDELTASSDGAWSIQQHAGHLWDLEDLGERRLQEFLSGKLALTAADMKNKKTEDAHHNARPVSSILSSFRTEREALVGKLEALNEKQVALTCQHPRLNKPMTIVDWLFFMSEHDDHHMARITRLLWARRP